MAASTPKSLIDPRERKSKVLRASAITATRLVTLPVTAEADAVLDLVLTREEVIAEMIETAAVAHQDLALTKEEIDTVEMIEIEEMVITEIEITIEKTDVILVALDLTRESAEEAEKEKDMEEEVEIVRKENRDHLSNVDLRSARENNAELAEAAVSIVAREEDLPRLVVMREKPEINLPLTAKPKSRDLRKVTKLKKIAKSSPEKNPGNSAKKSSKLLRKTETEFE